MNIHIYPGIPCYNLRKAHNILNEDEIVETVYMFQTHTTKYTKSVF